MTEDHGTNEQLDCPCPSTKQLRQWLDGEMEITRKDQQHLESCSRCTRVLASLSDDESLQELSRSSTARPKPVYSNEPEFERLRASLHAIPGDETRSPLLRSELLRRTTMRAEQERTEGDSPTLDAPSIEMLNQCLPSKRYVVDRLLAQGGTGAVYLAYDQRLSREVAIKVLARESHRDRQRFLREARVLAELEDTNIVQVFDFGVLASDKALPEESIGAGQLYLVMEYVSGGTANVLRIGLPDLFRSPPERDDSNSTTTALSYQRLATLLASAAEGLSAAHAKSMVHRDVKPGNLLLVADWSHMKVADFGLARQSDSDLAQVTRTGELLGTPAFMSPEQVSADDNVTASSDIYSLGATLYQLLTGEPPFPGNSAAVLRQIEESNPVAPRLLNASIPVDLEVICLHAMEKKPASRYRTMKEMADDLRRFAASEPILARPTSSSTKILRLIQKNRPLAFALSACVLLLLTLTIGSIATAVILRFQSLELSRSVEAERTSRVEAQRALHKSMEAADQLLLSVTEDTELLPRTPGSEEVARKLLNKAQDYYNQVIASGSGDDGVRFDAARARSGLAQISLRLGNPSGVETEAQAALELLDSIPNHAVPPAERVALRARTLVFLGKGLSTRGELRRAIQVMTDAADACEAELKQNTDNRTLRFLLADSLRGRAVAENMAGDLTQAEASLIRSQSFFEELLQSSPNDPKYLRLAAGCQSTLAVTLVRRDGYEAARKHLLQAIELLSRLEFDSQLPIRLRPDRASNLVNLASVEFHLGNLEKSRELFSRAEQEYQQLITLEPGVIDHKYNSVLTTLNSGKVDVATGTIDRILEKYRTLEPKLNALLDIDPGSREYLGTLGLVQGNIAVFLRMLGKTEDAIDSLNVSNETLRRYAELIDNTPESLQAISFNQFELSKCYLDLQRIGEGLQAAETSMATITAILSKHPDYLPSRIHQVDILIGKCELLMAADKVDSTLLLAVAEQAYEKSAALLVNADDLHECKVAHGLIFSILSEANLHRDQLDKSLDLSNQGIKHLNSLETDLQDKPTRDAYLSNYLAQSKVHAARLRNLTNGAEVNKDELRASLAESISQCEKFGATEEELASLIAVRDEK